VLALAIVLVSAGAGCSFVVDTSGLVGGNEASDTIADGSTTDQVAPVTNDSGGGVSPGADANGASDAGSTGDDGATGDDAGNDGGEDSAAPCTVTCDGTNATTTTCSGTTCSYTCGTGFDDCNASTGSDTDGCETPITTTTACGACGAACDTKTGTPSCDNGACSYACKTGHSDCSATGANTDGCECATPSCCGTGCQTTHSDGVGQTFYDCNDAGAPTQAGALAACAAYTGDPSACSGGWTCNGSNTVSVCYDLPDAGGCGNYCWNYSGNNNGIVTDCSCPGTKVGPWH
jgi:hypothetical protein